MPNHPPIEFWFDFSSPYAFFAAIEIDALAARHGREAHWRPFLLGVLFAVTGNAPLTDQPLKGAYVRHDLDRLARRNGITFSLPGAFPLRTQAAARMMLAMERSAGRREAARFARMIFEALFIDNLSVDDPDVASAVGAQLGFEKAVLIAAAHDPVWKEALRLQNQEAEDRGICGSPWIMVDGEPFWGADRLPMVEDWLAKTGGRPASRRA